MKDTEAFIVDHNYSPEFVDIPGVVYEKCLEKAFDKAMVEYPEISERYEELEVSLEENIPIALIMQLSEDVKNRMLQDDLYAMDETQETMMRETGPVEAIKQTVSEEFKKVLDEPAEESETMEEDAVVTDEKQMVPCKENTLYLPIKQMYFDQIVAGTKKKEFREIKPTTYKKYLKCDANGNPFVDTFLIDMNDPLCDDINVWNNGVYPLVPNDNYHFLHLAVGYNKERDEALVEIDKLSFEPVLDKNGKACRFDEENGEVFKSEHGKLCFWNIVYHLGRVLKVQRAVKNDVCQEPYVFKEERDRNDLKFLTLQINKVSFESILNGSQKVEHRNIYPSNESRYVRYICEGKEYKRLYDTPDNDSTIETIPIKYDALYLINGRSKNAPRLTVEVLDAEVVRIVDKDGNEVVYEDNGLVYAQCQIWYYLGKIISTENI